MAVSVKPYKGSRDFLPADMEFRNWMFQIQREICERYGYGEYAAPLLEPVDLYRMKSSEEIVGEQLYRFVDRGEREVAIRPEMTPSLARMVSGGLKAMIRPIRWFSIANFMRFERPGRGRLREFYQLNVDHMGTASPVADTEILLLSIDILRAYGADESHFKVRFSDRRLLDSYLGDLDREKKRNIGRLLDKREKISTEEFNELLEAECAGEIDPARVTAFLDLDYEYLEKHSETLDKDAVAGILKIRELCEAQGVGEYLEFNPAIMRGFDYYTGFIFEIFDTHPENNRSLFGGGRYDKLIGLFGKEEVPAVGFGLGDVTLENFLRSHDLVAPKIGARRGVFLALFNADVLPENLKLARELREAGIEVETALEPTKKLGPTI